MSAATLWIDIDNPPQVQYLAPVAEELQRRGHAVVVTARDNAITFDLLRERGTAFVPVGRSFGKQTWRKVAGVLGRSVRLLAAVRGRGPRLLLCASRSGALAARLLGIPCLMICDYEHVELGSFRQLGATIAFPDAIAPEAFLRQGFRADRLLPFPGLKEDLTFHGRDLDAEAPFALPDPDRVVVTFRPPAAETHYYSDRSAGVYEALLDHLAGQEGIHVVFLPRYPWQAERLRRGRFRSPVLVPERPIPPVPLLKGSDLVISSGGTMLREAAYLGVPAYSIFQSELGQVDRHLADQGRLVLIRDAADFARLRLEKRSRAAAPGAGAATMETLVAGILARVGEDGSPATP